MRGRAVTGVGVLGSLQIGSLWRLKSSATARYTTGECVIVASTDGTLREASLAP